LDIYLLSVLPRTSHRVSTSFGLSSCRRRAVLSCTPPAINMWVSGIPNARVRNHPVSVNGGFRLRIGAFIFLFSPCYGSWPTPKPLPVGGRASFISLCPRRPGRADGFFFVDPPRELVARRTRRTPLRVQRLHPAFVFLLSLLNNPSLLFNQYSS